MRRTFLVLAAMLLAALAVGLAGCGGGDDEGASPPPPPAATETETTGTETTGTEDGGGAADGAAVFASAGCGGCHTFTPARSSGSVGPNLDDTLLSVGQIEEQVRSGKGAMPAFEDQLSDEEIAAVAEYVASG